jgi:hypothetical protein
MFQLGKSVHVQTFTRALALKFSRFVFHLPDKDVKIGENGDENSTSRSNALRVGARVPSEMELVEFRKNFTDYFSFQMIKIT